MKFMIFEDLKGVFLIYVVISRCSVLYPMRVVKNLMSQPLMAI